MRFTSGALKARNSSPCFLVHSTAKIERKVKTMQDMTNVVIVNGKVIFDIETLFARLLVVGQQRGVEVTDIFQHELSHVPPSLIDEFGCLRKGDKTVLVKCLGVPDNGAPAPNVVLVVPASCCTMLSGLSLGEQAIFPRASLLDWAVILQKPQNVCSLTAIMRMS